MKCHICWKNTHTLIVGWADTVWVCNVERRSVVSPMDASVYVVCPSKKKLLFIFVLKYM